MANKPKQLTKKTLDKDLDKLTFVEDASKFVLRSLVAPGLAVLFLGMVMLFAGVYVFDQPDAVLIIAASALAAYMALNIGANDVTNNVGAAVGARAISMAGALMMAAVFEILGATIAGGAVTQTIASGIVAREVIPDANTLAWLMMAALTAAALWINLATWLNAPVSTTHSMVGAVLGAGIAATGFDLVNWETIVMIVVSWIVSPVLGALIAIFFLYILKETIIYRENKIAAANRWVPILVAIMVGSFATYIILQTANINHIPIAWAAPLGLAAGFASWLAARPLIARQSIGLENRNDSLRKLFRLPLIFSAALLSFAHGANDVSNAIGPLSAIVHVVMESRDVAEMVTVPFWVMAIGALGISVGLLLFGPRLIRIVGEQITKLNPMRAYCVALSAAVTVIVASWLGLPVSSTHIAVGAVFGVGFFREWYTRHSRRRIEYMRQKSGNFDIAEPEDRNPDETRRRYLVRRSHLMTIGAAWVITVPISAALAAVLYWIMFALFI